MASQVIKAPDGTFAVFSSVTDTITFYDATAEELVEYFAEKAANDARRHTRNLLAQIEGPTPRAAYSQFTLTWEQALDRDRQHGGEAHLHYRSEGD